MAYKLGSTRAREDYLRLNCADVHEKCDPGDWLGLNRADVHEILYAAPNLLLDRY